MPDALDCDAADPAHWLDCGQCIDWDGDGFGALCDLGDDCDDADPTVNPDGIDVAIDGIDQDCSGFDGPTRVDDAFELGVADPAFWASVTGDASVLTDSANSGSWSLNLGGGRGDATPLTFDTSGCASVSWGYWGKRGPELPDASDWLRLEYWDGLAWVLTDDWPGGATDPTFLYRDGDITDPLALSATFRARFTSYGGGSGFDDYFVDDFAIGCGPETARARICRRRQATGLEGGLEIVYPPHGFAERRVIEFAGFDEVIGGLSEALPEVLEVFSLLADLKALAAGGGGASELGATALHQSTNRRLEEVTEDGGELALLGRGRILGGFRGGLFLFADGLRHGFPLVVGHAIPVATTAQEMRCGH